MTEQKSCDNMMEIEGQINSPPKIQDEDRSSPPNEDETSQYWQDTPGSVDSTFKSPNSQIETPCSEENDISKNLEGFSDRNEIKHELYHSDSIESIPINEIFGEIDGNFEPISSSPLYLSPDLSLNSPDGHNNPLSNGKNDIYSQKQDPVSTNTTEEESNEALLIEKEEEKSTDLIPVTTTKDSEAFTSNGTSNQVL